MASNQLRHHHPQNYCNEPPNSNMSMIGTIIIMTTIVFVIIITTRPKPAYGRQPLAGLWGQDTDEVITFLVFLTSHFAPAALSSDLTNLGPLTMETDQKP